MLETYVIRNRNLGDKHFKNMSVNVIASDRNMMVFLFFVCLFPVWAFITVAEFKAKCSVYE